MKPNSKLEYEDRFQNSFNADDSTAFLSSFPQTRYIDEIELIQVLSARYIYFS